MWVARLKLPSTATEYEAHRALWDCFPRQQAAGAERPFCFRRDGDEVLMYSSAAPSVRASEIQVQPGQPLLFETIASVRRGTYRDESGKRKRMRPYSEPHKAIDWLLRRLEGATVEHAKAEMLAPVCVRKPAGNVMVFGRWAMRGTLVVQSAQALDAVLARGIGQGCAFGLGLVVLPEVIYGRSANACTVKRPNLKVTA